MSHPRGFRQQPSPYHQGRDGSYSSLDSSFAAVNSNSPYGDQQRGYPSGNNGRNGNFVSLDSSNHRLDVQRQPVSCSSRGNRPPSPLAYAQDGVGNVGVGSQGSYRSSGVFQQPASCTSKGDRTSNPVAYAQEGVGNVGMGSQGSYRSSGAFQQPTSCTSRGSRASNPLAEGVGNVGVGRQDAYRPYGAFQQPVSCTSKGIQAPYPYDHGAGVRGQGADYRDGVRGQGADYRDGRGGAGVGEQGADYRDGRGGAGVGGQGADYRDGRGGAGVRGQGAGYHGGNPQPIMRAGVPNQSALHQGYSGRPDTGRHLRPEYATRVMDMDNDPPLSLAPHKFEAVKLFQDGPLGQGSYGSVYRARCEDTLTCAAKVIHQKLLVDVPDAKSPQGRFRQECEILSSLRHPNVVQYLGTHVDAENRLMLLMELMDQSLTGFLKESVAPLPFHTQVNICHDISLALSFLHLKSIVHRDLSSNNVLMIGDRRAKVTDFGMAKWRMMETKNTACPGTRVYMPPEALDEGNPVYSDSIDCFSLGVLAIQILTRKFPAPGSRQRRSYTGDDRVMVEEISEIDRRKEDIDSIDPENRILHVAKRCLVSKPEARPTSRVLSLEFEEMKGREDYRRSVGSNPGANHAVPVRGMSELEQVISAQREEEMVRLRREVFRVENLLRAKDNEIAHLQESLEQKERWRREWQDMQQEVTSLRREVAEKEQLVSVFEQERMSALKEKEEMHLQLKKEVGQHKDTRQLLEETLQSTTAVQPPPKSTPAVISGAINLSHSLPANLTFPLNLQRRRAQSNPATMTTHRVPLQKQSSLTFDLQEPGVLLADLKPFASQDRGVKARVTPTFEVSFTPEVRGWHKLDVSMNGMENSSCDVFVDHPIENIDENPVRVIPCKKGSLSKVSCFNRCVYYTDQTEQKYHILDVSSGEVLTSVWCKRSIKCITVDAEGFVFFTSNHKVHKFSPQGDKLAVFGDDSSGYGDSRLNLPEGLAVDVTNGHVHVCDSCNHRVVVLNSLLSFVGKYGEGITTKIKVPKSGGKPAHLQGPVDIAFNKHGRAFVLDREKRAVVIFKNRVFDSIISLGAAIPVALDFRDNHLLVVDLLAGLCVYNKSGGRWDLLRKIGVSGSAVDVCTDPDGFIYVADSDNSKLMVY